MYPNTPGWKERQTSKDAAEEIKPSAATYREKCLRIVEQASAGLTPDEAAEILNVSVLTIRPRFSELSAQNKIKDSGVRGKNTSGKRAIVWVIA